MALICDTGAVYAIYDADDLQHGAVKAAVEAEPGALLLPVVLLAEIDYLLSQRLSIDAALDFLESVERGALTLVMPSEDDLIRCRDLMVRYRDLNVGIADASVVATAERLGIQRLLTLDERHFRTIKPRTFSHFILLPADAP
jgi:uncharacterized protein